MTFLHQPYKISRPARAPAAELGLVGSIHVRSLPLTPSLRPWRQSAAYGRA